MSSVERYYLFGVSSVASPEGNIGIINNDLSFPFQIKRIFYEYGVPKLSVRGKHANRNSKFCFVCVSGSCLVKVNDGNSGASFLLDSPSKALFIDKMVWKEMRDFSTNCVLLVLSDSFYDSKEYIRDFESYLKEMAR